MPREAAEYEVQRALNQPPPRPSFDGLFGVESESDLAALTPKEVLARLLKGGDHRWRYRAYLDELAEKHPQYRDQLERQRAQATYMWSGTPAGCVERAGRAYVVLTSAGPPREELPDDHTARVVVLRRSDGAWRISSDVAPSSGMLVHFHVAVKNERGDTVVLS
jgi:hypothetical protein